MFVDLTSEKEGIIDEIQTIFKQQKIFMDNCRNGSTFKYRDFLVLTDIDTNAFQFQWRN